MHWRLPLTSLRMDSAKVLSLGGERKLMRLTLSSILYPVSWTPNTP